MAAFTRSGARKASEIVIVTFCTLHFSRLAMLFGGCWVSDELGGTANFTQSNFTASVFLPHHRRFPVA